MNAAGESQWSKRLDWANCREPYKTQLDTLGDHWLQGLLSNEALAFEAVKLLSELKWVRKPSQGSVLAPMQDVISQVQILTEAMLAASLHPAMTRELRREALDFMRTEFGADQERER